MADKRVGVISHYYNHLGVAIIEVESPFAVDDTLKFVRHGTEEEIFQQKIESIQVEHEQVVKAEKGMSVGIKVNQLVHENVEVYKA